MEGLVVMRMLIQYSSYWGSIDGASQFYNRLYSTDYLLYNTHNLYNEGIGFYNDDIQRL